MLVLQLNPLLVVQSNALPDVEHEPIDIAVGAAEPAVALASMVLAAWLANPVSGNAVPLVRLIADGVPKFGVISIGLVE